MAKTWHIVPKQKWFVQKIKNDINSGTIDKKEGKSLVDAVNALNGIVDKVPQDIDVKLRKKAVGLLYNKSLLLHGYVMLE